MNKSGIKFQPLLYVAQLSLLAAVYFGGGKLGLTLSSVEDIVTIVWPPTGIALAALLLFGYRLWPGIALGAFLVNISAGASPAVVLGISVGNTLEAVVGAYLLRRVVGFDNSMQRLRDVLGLVSMAVVVSTMVSATIGAASLGLGGIIPWTAYGSTWWVWWLGDAMGALLVAPVLLTWGTNFRLNWPPGRLLEAVSLLVLLVVISQIAVERWLVPYIVSAPLSYTLFPFLVWAALRFDQRGAVTMTLVGTGLAVWNTAHGFGPFVLETIDLSLVYLSGFMGVAAVTAMLLAAAITERQQAQEALRQAHNELERRVVQRTAELHQERNFVSAVLETASALIAVFDRQGHIVRFNRTCEQLTGYAFEEVQGKQIWDLLLLPEEEETVKTIFDQLLAGQFSNRHESHWVTRDGKRRLVVWSNTTLLDSEGLGEYVISTGIDITERKEIEAEKDRLLQEVSQHEELLRRLGQQLATVEEAERKQLARELHDQVGSNLAAIGLNLNIIQGQIPTALLETDSVQAHLTDAQVIVEQTTESIRNIMTNLHPPALDDYGLVAAVRWYVNRLAARVPFTLIVQGQEPHPPLADVVKYTLFRVVQEALTNVAKHAQATQVIINIETNNQTVQLSITDDGRGFEPGQVNGTDRSGWGLLSMRERAERISARCNIESEPGRGTRIRVEVPQ